MQLDERVCTPGLLARLVRLVGTLPSFALAAAALGVARDTVRLSGRQVQRLTQPVGAELVTEQDRQAEAYRRRELSLAAITARATVVLPTPLVVRR